MSSLGVFAVCIIISRCCRCAERSGIDGVIYLHSAGHGSCVNADLLTPALAEHVCQRAVCKLGVGDLNHVCYGSAGVFIYAVIRSRLPIIAVFNLRTVISDLNRRAVP